MALVGCGWVVGPLRDFWGGGVFSVFDTRLQALSPMA
jgi:hypothetical protein